VPPAARPRLTLVPTGGRQASLFRAEAESIRRLARLDEVEVEDAAAQPPGGSGGSGEALAAPGGSGGSGEALAAPGGSGGALAAPPVDRAAKLLTAGAELYLPLEGLLDLDEERARLDRELAGLDAERARAAAKLANQAFIEKAPPAVVERARDRLAEVEAALAKVRAQRAELGADASV
jgi:valyl-tRNA synthetase